MPAIILGLQKLFRSKVIIYVFNRYLAYGIQFLNAILFAKLFGTFYLGVYGFIMMLIQYSGYLNFGVNYALNFHLSTEIKTQEYSYWRNSLTLMIIVAFLLLIFCLICLFFNISLFSKYNFSNYIIAFTVISIFQLFNQLYVNLYRTYGMLRNINVFQTIVPLFQLFGTIFLSGEYLLMYVLWSMAISGFISFILFVKDSPFPFQLEFNSFFFKTIFKKGIHLLLYNMSYFLISLSGKTLVSGFYTVENMGQYAFATSLANGIMMVMGALSFVFFSKMINKLNKLESKREILDFIKKTTDYYVNGSFLLIFSFFAMLPFLVYLLPEYGEAFVAFRYLLLGQLILANVFSYSTFLIAKQKEAKLTFNALITTVINVVFCSLLIYFKYSYLLVGLSTLICVFYYNVKTVYDCNSFMLQYKGGLDIIKNIYPLKFSVPFLTLLLSVVFDYYFMIPLALVMYIYMNHGELKKIIIDSYHILVNKDILKL